MAIAVSSVVKEYSSENYHTMSEHILTVFLILNYKTYNDTISLVNELLNFTSKNRKILVVDNDSKNNSFEIISDYYRNNEIVEVISSGLNAGYARGNNYGLRYIAKYSPKYVCIINNDVHFSERTILNLERRYEQIKDVAILSPLQYNFNDDCPVSFLNLGKIPTFVDDCVSNLGLTYGQKHIYQCNSNYSDLQKVKIIPGAFIFINYEVFNHLKFFDEETFLFGEERFTAKKIENANLNSYLLLNDKYIHKHSVTINQEASMFQQRKYLFNSKIAYTKKYRKYSKIKVPLLYLSYYLGYGIIYLKQFINKIIHIV